MSGKLFYKPELGEFTLSLLAPTKARVAVVGDQREATEVMLLVSLVLGLGALIWRAGAAWMPVT